MFNVQVDRLNRTVRFRATGRLTLEDLQRIKKEAHAAYDQFRGAEHLVLADMRGMSPLAQEAAQIFGEVIRYGREHGTVCCVHLSDSSIARLQANRLAREASPVDEITIDVDSPDEAEKLIKEKQTKLRGTF